MNGTGENYSSTMIILPPSPQNNKIGDSTNPVRLKSLREKD